jgi:hypothetical protein
MPNQTRKRKAALCNNVSVRRVRLTDECLELDGITVSRDTVSHPLLGNAHVIEHAGRVVTAMSKVDWDRPTQIPTVAEPGRLPPGSGSELLNTIAELAFRAAVPSLRYAGPYPTPALYRSLARSFRASADEATFTANVLDRAMHLTFDEIPVDFAPAPHERIKLERGFVELREGPLRLVIDRISYEPDGSPARLTQRGASFAAEIWFGDAPWALIAEIDARGHLTEGPRDPPAMDAKILGEEFPLALRGALAQLISEAVPAVLAEDAGEIITRRPVVWADLGARAARFTGERFEVHAALWERVGPLGLGRLALAIAEALAPVVTRTILVQVSRSN